MSLDGNPYDMATILVAVLIFLIKPIKRLCAKLVPCFTVRDIVLDFLSGTVIVSFLLLIGSTFSQHFLEEALKSNKIFFSVGGFIGLIFVLREVFRAN